MDDRNAGSAGDSAPVPESPSFDDRTRTHAGLPEPSQQSGSSFAGRPVTGSGSGVAHSPGGLESDQKTVISKTPPTMVHVFSRAGVQDLGRMLVGERLGHFVLEEFVGGGGMGAVFRATDTELGRTVAVKVVSGVHNDDETLRRFKNEAQSAARLDHHNIARVYYVGEDKGWHYIVFEFINGVNVRDLVEHRGPLPLEEAISYTLQVAEALQHASQRDVVHRDIKPSNVLVMQDGTVKLVDMGLARLHQVESATDDLTASGVTLGTFDYISPEQARDPRNADVRSDLYSLGCTLYYMLTGRPPFPEGTVLQKLLSHSSDTPPDPRDLRPDLPDDITDLLHKLLAKNPNDRFQQPADLIGRLLVIASELDLPLSRRHTAVLVSSPASGLTRFEYHLPWLVPSALLLIVVLFVDTLSTARPLAIRRPDLPAPVRPTVQPSATPDNRAEPTEAADMQPGTSPERTSSSSLPPSSVSPTRSTATDERPPVSPTVPVRVPESTGRSFPDATVASLTGEASQGVTIQPQVEPTEIQGATAKVVVGPLPPESNSASGRTFGDATSRPLDEPDMGSDMGPQVVTRLLVAPGLNNPPRDAIACTSLAAALQRATEFDDVQTIELWYNGELQEGAILAPARDEPLIIRAGQGYQPVITFRPQAGQLAGQHMIELTGGSTVWSNLHLRMELPQAPSERWSLFYLRGIESIQLQNCTLTIQNASETGLIRQQNVAFFELEAQSSASRMNMGMNMGDGMGDDDVAGSPAEPPSIQLTNCSARGQADFLRADLLIPCELIWTRGLLVSSERLFHFGGSVARESGDHAARIELTRVTAIVDRGLGRVAVDSRGPVVPELAIDLNDCIVMVDDDQPLLEHVGVPSIRTAEDSLEALRGRGNYYPTAASPVGLISRSQRRTRWRIETATGETRTFTFDDRAERWYQEVEARDALDAVRWQRSPPTSVPYHLHKKSDYVPTRDTRHAGFEVDLLPAFPEPTIPAGGAADSAASLDSRDMR